jgi:hypothetical protein
MNFCRARSPPLAWATARAGWNSPRPKAADPPTSSAAGASSTGRPTRSPGSGKTPSASGAPANTDQTPASLLPRARLTNPDDELDRARLRGPHFFPLSKWQRFPCHAARTTCRNHAGTPGLRGPAYFTPRRCSAAPAHELPATFIHNNKQSVPNTRHNTPGTHKVHTKYTRETHR